MSSEILGLIGIVVMLVLLFSGMYVAASIALLGFIGIACIGGFHQAFIVAGTASYTFIANYSFSVAPMFILMGNIVSETGIGADLYYAAHKWIGQLRGGLAAATIAASALFSAITGDSTSGIIVFSKIALPEMKKFEYSDPLSTGTVVAGAALGSLIPPSMGFVMYGILTEQSVGKLFMAGIIPGVLQALFYMVTIYIWCRFKPLAGPAGPTSTFKEKVASIRMIWAAVALFLLVMGGIYTGIFTPTEAGAVGAFGAIIITIVSRRFTTKGFLNILLETGVMTAMFMLLMMGIPVFQKFMTLSELPFWLGDLITGFGVSPILVIVIIVVMYIILGTALPAMMCIILTLPIFYPLIVALGFDPIWYGVICVRMADIGDISPPEGMNVFILSGLSGIPIMTIFRGVIPFLIADCFHVALLIAIPSLSLFLPNAMK